MTWVELATVYGTIWAGGCEAPGRTTARFKADPQKGRTGEQKDVNLRCLASKTRHRDVDMTFHKNEPLISVLSML